MADIYTDAGEAITTARINGTGTAPTFVAMGTGAGTAAKADTTLFTESAEARATGTASVTTNGSTNNNYRVVGTQTATAARTITNGGNFDASTTGNLFAKSNFAASVGLNTGDSLQQTIDVTFG